MLTYLYLRPAIFMNALLLFPLFLSAQGGWTQIHLTNQIQCKSPYVLTVGIPANGKETVIRIEKDGKTLVEKGIGGVSIAEAAVFDADDSGCEEALVDVSGEGIRAGALIVLPKGKPEMVLFPATSDSASKAKRTGNKVRAFAQKGAKLCITDYAIKNDGAKKAFEDCY